MQHWVFGYGSLIWRVDFPYHARRRASVQGWSRRFWQGSHDHRGTPDAPGRVVTLTPDEGAVCVGMAYRVNETVFEHLDQREKNGYQRVAVDVDMGEHEGGIVGAVTYIAPPGNPAFLGPAPVDEMIAGVARSAGPSGSNADYVLKLAAALNALHAEDEHVAEIAAGLSAGRS